MTDNHEKRQSFRIIESVLLQYEMIDENDYRQGLDSWRNQSGVSSNIRWRALDLDSRLHEMLYSVKNDSTAAAEAIDLLNAKLNIILEALPEFSKIEEALADRQAQTCELSAEGIVFGINEILAPQTKILLRFLLISDNRFIETFGHVVRMPSTHDFDACPHSHRVAVEFDGLSAAEREILIQHLLTKQSEILRLRRKQSEAAV